MSILLVAAAAFLASAVEMVEAMTIVVAVGVTRGWRSTLVGVGVALVTLATITVALGPALVLAPIDALRLLVGGLLLVFGLQWLRKAILRASGFRALHDEDELFETQREAAGSQVRATRSRLDWYAFTVSFKGVLLEGLEVAFIVITVGAATNQVALAALGAAAAVFLVGGAGLAVNRPLSRVPENTLKYAVGLMLSSFGTFWAAEGTGVLWPGSDGAILGLLAFYLVVSQVLVKRLEHHRLVLQPAG